ncbi:hypothetical protein ACO1O0_003486 [Amphichorda felina]
MAHSEGNKKPLWLIQPRLDASQYRDTLIGSVVEFPDLPTERHIPYRCGKLPRDMVPKLDPKPIQVRNLRFWQRRIHDTNVSATLNDILEAFGERAREEGTERTATVARMWHMDSPGEQFKELLKNKLYFEELFELLQSTKDKQAYFVTDIVTLVNLEETDQTGRTTGGGVTVNLPLEVSAPGVQIGFSGGGSVKHQVKREKGYSAAYTEEVIVFLGYRRVLLEKVTGKRAKLERMFLGEKHGLTIRDGFDYWPELVARPHQGNVDHIPPLGGSKTPDAELERELGELYDVDDDEETRAIVQELGFDVRLVG